MTSGEASVPPEPPSPTGGRAASGGSSGGGSGDSHGGESSGGSSVGGGGASAVGGVPLPVGCEPRTQTETEDSCSLAAFCDEGSRVTSCQRGSAGSWRCQCDPFHRERVYEVENAAGVAACAVMTSACSAEELELGAESCDQVGTMSGPSGDCSTEMSCRRPIALGVATDARAYLVRFGSSRCESSSSGQGLECSCRYQGADEEYELLVEGDATGCGPLVELCMSGGSPDYDGAEECLTTSAKATDKGCERVSACLVPATIAEGVRLGVAEPRFAGCEAAEGGGSDCYCSTNTVLFQLRTADAPSAATCEAVQAGCAPGAVIEATGDAACEPASQEFSSSTWCEADLDCEQSATVDGRDVVAIGRLLVRCARTDDDNPWWCSCASDQATARFSLGMPTASSADACGQAPARCLEALDVHLGPYGAFMSPPEPLP